MKSKFACLTIILMISVAFALDHVMPLGIAVWLLYLPPLLLSLWWLRPTTTVLFAAVCSALILTGLLFMENALLHVGIDLLNRCVAIGVICIIIFIGLRYKNAVRKIQHLAENLNLQAAELAATNRDLEAGCHLCHRRWFDGKRGQSTNVGHRQASDGRYSLMSSSTSSA